MTEYQQRVFTTLSQSLQSTIQTLRKSDLIDFENEIYLTEKQIKRIQQRQKEGENRVNKFIEDILKKAQQKNPIYKKYIEKWINRYNFIGNKFKRGLDCFFQARDNLKLALEQFQKQQASNENANENKEIKPILRRNMLCSHQFDIKIQSIDENINKSQKTIKIDSISNDLQGKQGQIYVNACNSGKKRPKEKINLEQKKKSRSDNIRKTQNCYKAENTSQTKLKKQQRSKFNSTSTLTKLNQDLISDSSLKNLRNHNLPNKRNQKQVSRNKIINKFKQKQRVN